MPSKLGPHCLIPTAAARELIKAGAPIAKLVDDFGPAEDYLTLNPKLLLLGRGYTPLTLLEQLHSAASPQSAAEQFVSQQYDRFYRPNPLITYWEGHNEPSFGAPHDPGALDRMAWYAEFEVHRLRLLAQAGLKGIIGNFSTGYPEVYRDNRMWLAFLPALHAAKQHGGLLGVHEYSAPFMWWLTGSYQPDNCDGVVREHIGRRGWLTLRYRFYYEDLFRPHGLDDLPLVITELGCDAVGHNCPGMPSGAWQDLADYWNQHHTGADDPIVYWRSTPAHQRSTDFYYAEQLIWYDREIRQDAYVLGATIFTFGSNSPTWAKYNVAETRVPVVLSAYIRGVQHEPNPVLTPAAPPISDPTGGEPTAPPVETAPPRRGTPRSQYRRVYILLPPTATDPAWPAAALAATWDKHRATVGGSADDAGIGNLHARATLAVNPDGWGSTPPLASWFSQHYPGLSYASMAAKTPDRLAAQLQNAYLPAPPLVSDRPPELETGRPRDQYLRRYVLFNPTAPASFVSTVAQLTWHAQRFTYGGSADDAGIGDLNMREVYAVNPQVGWESDLAPWFALHYPGVRYIPIVGETAKQVAEALIAAAHSATR